MTTLDQEIAVFESNRSDLEKNHNGKWVLIHDKALIAIREDFDTIVTEAVKQFGRGPYLIRQVGAEPISVPAFMMYQPGHAEDNQV
jgi:hypothetical protein